MQPEPVSILMWPDGCLGYHRGMTHYEGCAESHTRGLERHHVDWNHCLHCGMELATILYRAEAWDLTPNVPRLYK